MFSENLTGEIVDREAFERFCAETYKQRLKAQDSSDWYYIFERPFSYRVVMIASAENFVVYDKRCESLEEAFNTFAELYRADNIQN